MSVTLRDARSFSEDREWIRAMYRDYLSELSVSKTGLFPALGEWDARESEFLAGWFAHAWAGAGRREAEPDEAEEVEAAIPRTRWCCRSASAGAICPRTSTARCSCATTARCAW